MTAAAAAVRIAEDVDRLGAGRYLGAYAPGTERWAQLRARRLGGSEIAAVLGLSPWESYFGLWHRKRGHLPPVEESDLMWWGTALEPVIADRFAHLHPELGVVPTGTYVNVDRDYQLISPDRLLLSADNGPWRLLEVKMGHDYDEWGPEGTDEIPVHYRCQVQWAMDALGVDSHRLAVYFGGDRYREYLVGYDEADARILRQRAVEFLAHVDAGGPLPDIDGHTATYQAVRALHPLIDDTDCAVPARLAEPYLAALEAVQECEAERRRVSCELAMHLGNARRALYGHTPAGRPRSIACRIPGRGADATPYLRASPLPKPTKEIS